jgi:hypothetical protein
MEKASDAPKGVEERHLREQTYRFKLQLHVGQTSKNLDRTRGRVDT